jgi:hypothetical protein
MRPFEEQVNVKITWNKDGVNHFQETMVSLSEFECTRDRLQAGEKVTLAQAGGYGDDADLSITAIVIDME